MSEIITAVKRVLQEKHPLRFVISRILLRLHINVPFTLSFQKGMSVRTYFHASSAAHKLFIGRYNPELDVAVFKKFINNGKETVYDIGANIGMFSTVAARLAPHGIVYAFEATPKTFSFLLDNISLNEVGNVYPVYAAVTDTDGMVSFFEHEYSQEQNFIDITAESKTLVPAMRLDSFQQFVNAEKVDFMKIDVEGAELQVLESMGKHLEKVQVIYLEVLERNSKRFNYSEIDIVKFLGESGYSLYAPMVEGGELSLSEYSPSIEKGLNIVAIRDNKK